MLFHSRLAGSSQHGSARVLKDLGRSTSDEARIILGAAVVDNVRGLIILATVVGIIRPSSSSESFSYLALGEIVLKAAVFLLSLHASGRRARVEA